MPLSSFWLTPASPFCLSRRERSRSRERDRERSPRDRSHDRDHDRGRDYGRRRYSDYRDRDRDRGRDRSRDRERDSRRPRSFREEKREKKEDVPLDPAVEAERDSRTVFVQNLPLDAVEKDLYKFFEEVGPVNDIRLITDRVTGRSKGFGYVEFKNLDHAVESLKLTGTKCMKKTITVRPVATDKNRTVQTSVALNASVGPTRLYVGSLHYNIAESDLRGLFSTCGDVEFIDLHKDETGKSKGFAFVQFKRSDDAQKALIKCNGIELCGRNIKVGLVNSSTGPGDPMNLQLALGGLNPLLAGGAPGLPAALGAFQANPILRNLATLAGGLPGGLPGLPGVLPGGLQMPGAFIPPPSASTALATQCLRLRNMFNPDEEEDPDFHLDIKEDVTEEAGKFGPVKHVHVDRTSKDGLVYVSFQTVEGAQAAQKVFHGRFFSGRTIVADFITEAEFTASCAT